jgi:glycosyltransferase 2 family protein
MLNNNNQIKIDPVYKVENRSSQAHLSLLIKIAIVIVILWILYYLKLLQLAPLKFLICKPWRLLFLILLVWLTFPLCALRWLWLLQIQGIRSSFFDVFRIVYSSAFLGVYLPGVVGGDVVRVFFSLKLSARKISEMALSVVVDRMLGVFAIFALGFIACLVYIKQFWDKPVLLNLILILTGIFIVGLLNALLVCIFAKHLREICRLKKFQDRGFILKNINRILESFALYSDRPGWLLLGLGLSILVHGKNLAILVLLAKLMSIGDLGIWEFAIAGSVSFLINFLPLTPGGIGIGESAFALLSSYFDHSILTAAYGTIYLTLRALTVLALLPALILVPVLLRR